MNALLDTLRATVEALILTTGYWGIGVLMFVENIVPPVPAEFVLPFAGFLVASGDLAFAGVLTAATLGSTLGTCAFYAVGRTLGEPRVQRLVARYGRWILVSEGDYAAALARFHRHGAVAVFWGRFVPGLRSLVSLPAGVTGMPFGHFAVLTVAGTTLWNVALIGAGVLLERRWGQVVALLERAESGFWVLALVCVIAWLVRRWTRTRTVADPS